MTVRKQEMTKEEYNSLPLYMKNRLEPVFIPSKEEPILEEKVIKEVIEVKKDEEGKYSYTDLKDFKKSEQVKLLKDFGLDDLEIKSLKKEDERINMILDLQKQEKIE